MKRPLQTEAEAFKVEASVTLAISHLRSAAKLLKAADARRAHARVRAALSSAAGAKRNAGYYVSRARMAAAKQFIAAGVAN